ncbi:MAG TPA: protein kinase [Thermoanaerobaculia bacterium]|jgi:serine/threonine-protein kinase|nr:protein kinase [Thermoanaerobaculia bacterium]
MSTPSPGSLEGKYEVFAKLREGGMGAIYKVRHRLLNELRVIKVMRPEVAQSADQRKRFLREAQTATRLRHPNIVAFYDFFVDEEDTAYMVMEYIEGINLRDMLQGCGALPVPLAIDLSRQCLSAFEYLHRRKIVHRDVSPDNIMMMREEEGTLRAKLIDLGIAKIALAKEELTAADEFIGKLRYSSPEQLMKSASSPQIDGRSDLFSFGIVLYEILTGVCPYGGESIHEIVANRLQHPPLSFEESDPMGRLSPELRAAVMKALQISPDERYQTAPEFSKALDAFAADDVGSRDPVEKYVNKCMTLATEAVRKQEAGARDLGPTMRSGMAAAEVPGRITDSRDLKFRGTIARWSGTTPPAAPLTPGLVTPAEPRQEMVGGSVAGETITARAAPRPSRPDTGPAGAKRRLPFVGYAAVAFAAALLVGFGVWVSGRDRKLDATASVLATPAAAESRDDRFPTPANVEREPTPLPKTTPASSADRESRASAEAVPPLVQPAVTGPAASQAAETKPSPRVPTRPRPTPAPRVAILLPTKPARRTEEPRVAVDTTGNAGRDGVPAIATQPKMHYCAQFDDTVYKQGVVKDVPTGFDGMASKAPRPDSGMMKISILLSKDHPADDEPFSVAVRFVNEGDARVDIQRLEESSSRSGMRQVGGAAVPVSVGPGGMKELHRYSLSLSGGDTYNKLFVVSDGKGDSWRTGIRLVPCD